MPPPGKEIELTELEMEIMSAFVKRKILDETIAMDTLLGLYTKLAGNYATYKDDIKLRDNEDRV